jgi:hypothetical protein
MFVAERAGGAEQLVGDGGRGHWHAQLACGGQRQVQVLAHHRHVKPGLFGQLEQHRCARLQHR